MGLGFWRQKEEKIRRQVARPWLGLPKSPLPRVSVVGEEIFVFVELRNPLMVPIELSQLQLVCKFEDAQGEPSTQFEVEPQQLLLAASAVKFIRLPVRPLLE